MHIKAYVPQNSDYVFNGGKDSLDSFKKVNIFVGANNTGKSRLLREMFASEDDRFIFFDDIFWDLKKLYSELEKKYSNYYAMKDLNKLISDYPTANYRERYNLFVKKVEGKASKNEGQTGSIRGIDVAKSILEGLDKLEFPREISTDNLPIKYSYIPILRGLRHLADTKQDFYEQITIKDYRWVGISENKTIFTGLSIYEQIKEMLLGSKEDRNRIAEFESFLEAKFFKKPITITPSINPDVVKVSIGEEYDFAIHEIGDGIQSIIISTFLPFIYRGENPLVLFIEEPELTMHPHIQRILIETLINEFSNIQVFFTTHSNHFIDLTYDYPDDVSVYSFEKKNSVFQVSNVMNNAIILDLLGVRNSSVFLSNSVIWTEGVTDRMFLRKILTLKNISYLEDKHYAFAEYGGANLENFDFLNTVDSTNSVNVKSISNKNFIVIDNDKDEIKAYVERRKNIKKVLGEKNVFDKHVEIENLVPFEIWELVIDRLFKSRKKLIKKRESVDKETFNSLLEKEKIGFLIKEYLVELVSDSNIPDYYKSDSITCLGKGKKEIMKLVLDVIDNEYQTFSEIENILPTNTLDIIKAIEIFIKEANT